MDNPQQEEKSLFRKKSLDKISSPEDLTSYLRVTTPALWISIAAISALLIGALVWGFFGRLQTKLSTALQADGTTLTCYVKQDDISKVAVGKTIKANNQEFKIKEVPSQPVAVSDTLPDYLLHLGSLEVGEWVYLVTADGSLASGSYSCSIIVGEAAPFSYIFG